MATETQSQHAAPVSRSMSRYHRRPAQLPPAPPVPVPAPPMPGTQGENAAMVSRSKSRYHRRPTASQGTAPMVPPPRSNTAPSQPNGSVTPATPSVRSRTASSPQHVPHAANTAQYRPRTAKQPSEVSSPASSSTQQSPPADSEARQILQREKERQRLLREKYEAEAAARREARRIEMEALERQQNEEAEAARLKAEQEAEAARQKAQQEAEEAEALRRQRAEQKAELERGKKLRKAESQRMQQQREEEIRRAKLEEKERNAQLSSPSVSPPRQDPSYALFKRRKDDGLAVEEPVYPSSPPRLSLGFNEREADTIRPGGKGAVLGIDAPASAVNAGDRRVTVVCGKKRVQLPVTPTTTPLDLIKSAATILTEPIDVRTSAVSELFARVNITRPLRNYEYVRDVLNSWDYDAQNELTILDTQLDGIDQDDLLSYKVPDSRPDGMSCFIHYSSRPGKWSKRYLTLRPDGQLVMAKTDKAKEKDMENICTLTDYDIYSVSQQKLAKVRPPKKICYAVKSMQKSNIFADESQYVHFFCTNDRATATMFYKALQSWRSWYLKHQKGEGKRKKGPAARNTPAPVESGHKRGESIGSHYQLGAFSSLLDMDDFNKKLDAIEVHKPGEFPDDKPLSRLDTKAMHARNKSLRIKQNPPVAFNRSAFAVGDTSQPGTRQSSRRPSMDDENEDTFASGGLLGRTYTQRRKEAQARDQQTSGPFTEGPSLLNNMGRSAQTSSNDSGLRRNNSVRSTHRRTSSDLQRNTSRRVPGMPEPLVDLTPQYRPPPQHANKGKAFIPGTGSGPLVESATSVEEAIKVPSSTDWRARAKTGRGEHGAYEQARLLKGRGEPLAAHTYNNHSGAPEDDSNAFTGGGLLSQAGFSQGNAPVGRGVMDGSRARGPMINLDDDNQFASGTLLSALPNSNGPIIDRSGK